MKKAQSTASPGRVLAAPVLCGLVLALILMMAGAMAVNSGRLPGASIPVAALACVGAGAFLSALLAARAAPRGKLLWGLGSGGTLFLCLLVLSLVWVGEPVALLRIALNAAVVLLGSGVGGMLGASFRKKRHKK